MLDSHLQKMWPKLEFQLEVVGMATYLHRIDRQGIDPIFQNG